MILLDFDGVLIDSRDEVVVNSYRLLTAKDAVAISDLPERYAKRMRRYRPYPGPAGDLLPLAEWCLNSNEEELSEAEFHALCERHPESQKVRATRFFDERKVFFAKHPKQWFEIHSVYEPFVPAVREVAERCVVLTNKNKTATLELLQYFSIPIPAARVFAGDNGVTKSENIFAIAEEFSAKKFVFIDDHIQNLADVMKSCAARFSIIPLLASWGFADKIHSEGAQKLGIRIIQQTEGAAIIRASD